VLLLSLSLLTVDDVFFEIGVAHHHFFGEYHVRFNVSVAVEVVNKDLVKWFRVANLIGDLSKDDPRSLVEDKSCLFSVQLLSVDIASYHNNGVLLNLCEA